MSKLEERVKILFKDIPYCKRKFEVMEEIVTNLSEKVEDLKVNGMTEDEAVKKAIKDFGDISELKNELERSSEAIKVKKLGLNLGYSIWVTLLTTALFVFMNFYYTPNVIWFVFPLFCILWWPGVLFFKCRQVKYNKKFNLPFAIYGATLLVFLFAFIDYYYTDMIYWFIYPTFVIVWWPISVFFHNQKKKEDFID